MPERSSARSRLTIALAQANPVVGAVAENCKTARSIVEDCVSTGADCVLLTELFASGYPPDDLVSRPAFVADCVAQVEQLAADIAGGPALLIGTPWPGEVRPRNAVALLDGGRVVALRSKFDLPNYGVFDEKRVFEQGLMPGPLDVRGVRIGVPICEDIWQPEVCECLAETGAELLLVPNGSPFSAEKRAARLNVAVARVTETGLPLAYLNQVGGQDELVFDGGSFVLNTGGRLAHALPIWREELRVTHWNNTGKIWVCEPGETCAPDDGPGMLYAAAMLALRDYVRKSGFAKVVLGLSGGIDSALAAALAVDALGPAQVGSVMLPWRYTAAQSLADAAACAAALGCSHEIMPIAAGVEGLTAVLGERLSAGVAAENLQSRARGALLMALSNSTGAMLVTTGNKSEMATGYATLYGDMNGGFNPLKDMYKTEVFALSRWRNTARPEGALGPGGEVIPAAIIARPPSAELAENQRDDDTLPPYDALDDMLHRLVDIEQSIAEIAAAGHAPETVARVARMVQLAEYKRRQAAPGPKLTARAFGRERRYPIVNAWRERP